MSRLPVAYQNIQHRRVMDLKYQRKCRQIKQTIKGFVLENAALSDEVADVQAQLVCAREDRRFLIKRLMRHENTLRQQQKLEREQQQQLAQEQQMQLDLKPMMPPPPPPPPRRKLTAKEKKQQFLDLPQQQRLMLPPKTPQQARSRGRQPKALQQQMQMLQQRQLQQKQTTATKQQQQTIFQKLPTQALTRTTFATSTITSAEVAPAAAATAAQINAAATLPKILAPPASTFIPRKRGPKKRQTITATITTPFPVQQQQQQEHQQLQQKQRAEQLLMKPPQHPPPKQTQIKNPRAAAAGMPRAAVGNRIRARDKVMLDMHGKPIFPINLCSVLIHAPGEIIPANPNFHNAHWIFPVGYVATRIYAHPKDPMRKCVYTCKILNNAGKPQFQIIPDNDLESVYFGETASHCHQQLLESLQRSLVGIAKVPMHYQGEKFFGLANPVIKSLLEMDCGFKLCVNFKGFQNLPAAIFVEDEKDPTMNFEALQMLISLSPFHMMPEVRAEPPDELLSMC